MTYQPHSATLSSSSELRSLFDTTFSDYEKQTGINLVEHQFSTTLNNCDTVDSIVATFRNLIQALNILRVEDATTIMECLKRIVYLLHLLSANRILGGVGTQPSFSLDKVIFAGLGVLLIAVDGSQVSANYDMLIDLFRSLETFLKRLNTRIKIPLTTTTTVTVVRILLQLLSTLGLATQQVNQGRLERVGEMLLGENYVEAVLQRLGNTSQNESRTAAGQALEIIYGLFQNMNALMDDGKASTDDIKYALVIVQRLAGDIIDKSKRDQLVKDVQVWLSPTDPSESHDIVRKAYHPGTATWFIKGHTFSEWKKTGSLLWIHGKPGSGKSVLCSTIIQEIATMREAGLASMAYFYFDFKDTARQNARDLVSSLLSQLCEQSDRCSDILSRLYPTHAAGSRQPSIDALLECLTDMLALPGQGPIYIILDGLDESPKSSGTPSKRESILELVERLVDLRGSNLRICVSSCAETDIREVLQPLASQIVSLHDEMGHVEDINDYINFFVGSDLKMKKWGKEDKDFVINKLSQEAGGMYGTIFLCAMRNLFTYWYRFRWVFCQLDQLRRCLPESIQPTLNEFPEILKEGYERILQDIDEKRWMRAQHLFQFLAVASRPLRVSELAEFLTWDFQPNQLPVFEKSWRPGDPEDALLSTCSSLIVIVDEDGSPVVQFSHSSVKQYLSSSCLAVAAGRVSRYHFFPDDANITVAQVCLGLLLQLDGQINKRSIADYPLAAYAAQFVLFHSPSRPTNEYIQEALKCLFDPSKPHFATWVWIYNVDEQLGEPLASEIPPLPRATPLYYASQFNYLDIVHWLLSNGHYNFSDISGHYGTPIIAASAKGHYDVLQTLLRHGGKSYLYTQCPNGRSALYAASENGHQKIVALLLKKKATPNTWSMDQDNPLGVALRKGHLEVVKLLLERGADVNHQNKSGETLLHLTSKGKYDLAFAQLLLDHGAKKSIQDNRDQTALQVARANGQEKIAQLLSK
ncbi:hypothetical protein B0F90DRAFT_1822471 [Multifurca ochricompacta]|uniref:NACHT domain-containing protein n=1 Tax=Multifurca ochricompacta TaxID=376703 RepID=A0AAD4LYN6_9AGAM|nr:hypothetical protein B0F90DRAFT_1822471 [Multifurca ochricompacta]